MREHMRRREDFEATLTRMILQSMNDQNRTQFIRKMTHDFDPDIQVKLYEFARAMIQSWAGKKDLAFEDAAVIEESRKICDVMGWPTGR